MDYMDEDMVQVLKDAADALEEYWIWQKTRPATEAGKSYRREHEPSLTDG